MEFGKRRDTADTRDFCRRRLVTDLLQGNWCNRFRANLLWEFAVLLRTCYGDVANLLQTCYGFVVYVAVLLRIC